MKAFRRSLTNFCVFSMLVSSSLLLTILGAESGRLGLQQQGFGVRCVAKTNFSQKFEFLLILQGSPPPTTHAPTHPSRTHPSIHLPTHPSIRTDTNPRTHLPPTHMKKLWKIRLRIKKLIPPPKKQLLSEQIINFGADPIRGGSWCVGGFMTQYGGSFTRLA